MPQFATPVRESARPSRPVARPQAGSRARSALRLRAQPGGPARRRRRATPGRLSRSSRSRDPDEHADGRVRDPDTVATDSRQAAGAERHLLEDEPSTPGDAPARSTASATASSPTLSCRPRRASASSAPPGARTGSRPPSRRPRRLDVGEPCRAEHLRQAARAEHALSTAKIAAAHSLFEGVLLATGRVVRRTANSAEARATITSAPTDLAPPDVLLRQAAEPSGSAKTICRHEQRLDDRQPDPGRSAAAWNTYPTSSLRRCPCSHVVCPASRASDIGFGQRDAVGVQGAPFCCSDAATASKEGCDECERGGHECGAYASGAR